MPDGCQEQWEFETYMWLEGCGLRLVGYLPILLKACVLGMMGQEPAHPLLTQQAKGPEGDPAAFHARGGTFCSFPSTVLLSVLQIPKGIAKMQFLCS